MAELKSVTVNMQAANMELGNLLFIAKLKQSMDHD